MNGSVLSPMANSYPVCVEHAAGRAARAGAGVGCTQGGRQGPIQGRPWPVYSQDPVYIGSQYLPHGQQFRGKEWKTDNLVVFRHFGKRWLFHGKLVK